MEPVMQGIVSTNWTNSVLNLKSTLGRDSIQTSSVIILWSVLDLLGVLEWDKVPSLQAAQCFPVDCFSWSAPAVTFQWANLLAQLQSKCLGPAFERLCGCTNVEASLLFGKLSHYPIPGALVCHSANFFPGCCTSETTESGWYHCIC